MKPFVLSEDVQMLLGQWSKAKGFILPGPDFFAGIMEQMMDMLHGIFGEVVLIKAEDVGHQLGGRASEIGLPIVSMDGVYFQSPHTIQINRAVDQLGNDVGLLPRPGALTFPIQLQILQDHGLTEVVLVDDVVFSGHQMATVVQELIGLKVRVVNVVVAVSIGEGERFLAQQGVTCGSIYSFPEVIDEVCERDFYPGTPRSGRFIAGTCNLGMPYILPFGLPGKWASIPEKDQRRFSSFCLNQSLQLFEAIEQASGRPVDCADIERKFPGLPATGRFVDVLRAVRNSL